MDGPITKVDKELHRTDVGDEGAVTHKCVHSEESTCQAQGVHVDKLKPCRGVTPSSWLDQEPDYSDDDGAVEDHCLPARLGGNLTD